MSLIDTKYKRKSLTVTVFLLSMLLLVMFYIGLSYLDPPIENGIAINFGTKEFGMGNDQPLEKIKSAPKTESAPQKAVKTQEEVLTAENEESVVIPSKKESVVKTPPKEEVKKPVEKPKPSKETTDALSSILNATKSDGKATGSEGTDSVAGDKGSTEGNPYANSYYGSPGSGTGGNGWGLNGRSLTKSGKVTQDCNEAGRVVVQIEVDKNGNVISATPGVRGTTNNHPCLLEPARRTAFMHKWNFDSNAPNRQIGFIEINFRLGQ